MTRVVLNDFAGHAFTLDLAEALREAGFDIKYAYCSSNLTPHADFAQSEVEVRPISSGTSFEKHGIAKRLLSEIRYGVGSARHVIRSRPDTVVANQVPLGSLAIIWIGARLSRAHYVIWLQDLTSGLVAGIAGDRSVIARLTSRVERFLLRRADRLIAISDALADEAVLFGVRPDRVVVLPNWPALRLLPLTPKDNSWSERHELADKQVLLYSGTLAKKHSPGHLVALAEHRPDVEVVVITEGDGVTSIEELTAQRPLPNLRVLPYQPFHELHNVLATADVLIVLLNRSAARYSVPSKVMSYLCAGRPILGAIPHDNDAARIIAERAQAGVIVDPDDLDGFLKAADDLLADDDCRARLGTFAREFAEQEFGREAIVERFLHAAGITTVSG